MDRRLQILVQPHAILRLRFRFPRFVGRSDQSCERLLRWMFSRAIPFGGVKPPKFRRLFATYGLVLAGMQHADNWVIRTVITQEMAETSHEIRRKRPRRAPRLRKPYQAKSGPKQNRLRTQAIREIKRRPRDRRAGD